MSDGDKSSESATAPIAWLEFERDKKGKVKGMEEKTDGLRNAGFSDDEVQSPLHFLKFAHSSLVRVLINEDEIKTESLLYSLS